MIGSSETKKILYGGDYNPEQWPEEVWEEDMRILKLAHIDILTLNVFNWAMLQPDENTYDFHKLDKIMNMVRDNGFKVFMATTIGFLNSSDMQMECIMIKGHRNVRKRTKKSIGGCRTVKGAS